ncbi:MAG: hypothetical protein K8R88_13800 [Armatimonadetes bacterium]|nr:hypothetical protein [Armatimonadota bacterium]
MFSLLAHTAILFATGSCGGTPIKKVMQVPPPKVLAKAWTMLAEQGPIGTDESTKVALHWKDGAFYMHIDGGRKRHWKVVLAPPLRDMDWRIRILSPKKGRGQILQRKGNHKDPRVAWSQSFANAMPSLPLLFADAASFSVRAIPEAERVVYFLEISAPAAWITFTVKPSGEFVHLDQGF